MDEDRIRESGHLMLITPERVFYAGLLGRPRQRCSGAFHLYVAIKGGLRLSVDGAYEAHAELAVVLPNVRHTIASDHRSVICILVEPESVQAGVLNEVATRLSGPESQRFLRRIRTAYTTLRERELHDNITRTEFDELCFGEA